MIINPFVFGGGAPWTPAELTLRAWYDLSDTATVTVVSSAVSAVADKSGNGFTLTQGTAANRPAYTGTLNGLNVATFDGSNDQLNAAVALAGDAHERSDAVSSRADAEPSRSRARSETRNPLSRVHVPAAVISSGSGGRSSRTWYASKRVSNTRCA